MDKKKLYIKSLAWIVIKTLFVLAQLVVFVLLSISLIRMGVLTGWLVALIIGVLGLLLLFNIVGLLVRQKTSLAMQIICTVVSAICIAGGIFALRYTDAFNGFLNKITEQKPEMKAYSVIVMNDSEIDGLAQLERKYVGFLKIDNMVVEAEQHLQNIVEVNTELYDDVSTMADVLSKNIVNAIVLETDRLEMVKEESDILDDTRVIGIFEIELIGEGLGVSEKKLTEEPFILYISGSDSRDGIKATARTDVNIVTVVNPKQGKILLLSIPRDTYVQLRGTTGLRDKLSHSGLYGINMSKTTIEDFLGIKIDHTLKVSFETVVEVVDELDGIDIYSDKVMHLKATKKEKKICNYVIGMQHVDGDCALRFARERKSYNRGDRRRGENQQQVLTRIINKLSGSKDYLLKLPSILEIAADSFETSLSRNDITAFIQMQLDKTIQWEIESIGLDGDGLMEPTYSVGPDEPLYVMVPFEDSMQNALDKINEYLTIEETNEND
ncbi:LCP family protein [Candidatus Saccharibacteria bacterium]|nr:LCP family protein [Candidatus Saccharibacteria bacterium]